jgi:hypothetical protein
MNDIVMEFVKLISDRDCMIEFSDHSMGSFFSNWNDERMKMQKPIEILPYTHYGSFKMCGKKTDFENSSHPTLKQIGDISSNEDIEITFNNMGGTKVYKILNSNVKLISTGNQINSGDDFDNNFNVDFTNKNIFPFIPDMKPQNYDIYSTVPVHCEFNYNKAKIIVSSTHWCNLNSVETEIDVSKLKRYCTENMGSEVTLEFEQLLLSATDTTEQKRIISSCVRSISSGSKTFS